MTNSATQETPKRIQRKPLKVWWMPKGAIYVGRGSKWGNPFRVGKDITFKDEDGAGLRATATFRPSSRATATDLYRQFVTDGVNAVLVRFHSELSPSQIRAELAGKDLACWCPLDQTCHADVLLELANEVAA